MQVSFRRNREICRWSDLLAPAQSATLELLYRLYQIVDPGSVPDCERSLGVPGSILVTGESGSGKTTVLQTARDLCRDRYADPTSIMPRPTNRELSPREADRYRTLVEQGSLKQLRPLLHWVDVLDVEPMPAKANFLTTLLVCIRNSLEPPAESGDDQTPGEPPPGTLEELAGNEIASLNRLIKESALVWEEIQETDTRERAHRQEKAAEQYTTFRHDLTKLLKRLAAWLARRQGMPAARGRNEVPGLTLVVPIDNIDRSADHARAIFKLAQLVTSPHLIPVLAGDRNDIQGLLARGYWKALTHAQPGAIGNDGSTGDDERSIARRQAATVLSKVLPPHQRIEVGLVDAKEALDYPNPKGEKLRDLLTKFDLGPAGHTQPPRTLCDLFIRQEDKKDKKEKLTEVAARALQLTARQLISLWSFADNENATRNEEEPKRRLLGTYYVPRAMVRLLTAECHVPHWAAELIQERIVHRIPSMSTEMVLSDGEQRYLAASRTRSQLAAYRGELDAEEPDREDTLLTFSEVLLEEQHDFFIKVIQGANSELLPARLGAWLMILHDVLMYSPEPLVINRPSGLLESVGPNVVTTWHGVHDGTNFTVALRWPRPAWRTFHEHTLMNQAWEDILDQVLDRRRLLSRGSHDTDKPRVALANGRDVHRARQLIALAWIHVILRLQAESLRKRHHHLGGARQDLLTEQERLERWPYGSVELDVNGAFSDSRKLDSLRGDIVRQAADALECMGKLALCMPRDAADAADRALYEWLEVDFPRFFSGEFDTGLALEARSLADMGLSLNPESTGERVRQARVRIARRRRAMLQQGTRLEASDSPMDKADARCSRR